MKRSARKQGSALITVVLVTAGLVVIIGGLIATAIQSYRLEKVNEGRGIERAISESELEEIYYQFKTAVTTNKNIDVVPSTISANFLDYSDGSGTSGVSTAVATLGQPTTLRDTFLPKFRPDATDPTNPYTAANKWQVRRSLIFNTADKILGPIGHTKNNGTNYYLTAMVEVVPPPSWSKYGLQSMKVGRQMVYSVYTVLQKGLFYQGDMEMTPGTSFDIKGDIAVNGSIYMGAANSTTTPTNVVLNIFGNVTVTGYFNKDSGGNTSYFEPSPYYQPTLVGTTITAPVFKTSEASQLTQAQAPTNFLGGLDVSSALTNSPSLFANANDVYRAIITPPPQLYKADGTLGTFNSVDYPTAPSTQQDDSTISNVRLYNMASVIVTVSADGKSVSVKEFAADGSLVDAPASYTNAISTTPATMYDQREGKNVTVTNVDIGQLSALANDDNFQGVVYVNQTGASTGTNAIRVINAQSTPAKAATASSEAGGFTLATNGPLYIQGDYNSATPNNPSVILADTITALSAGWNDANSTQLAASRMASGSVTINAGIMTGNTPTTLATATSPATSGGAQNLVRYLENWTGQTVTLNGSLGRLFDSKYFTGAYRGSNYLTPTRNIIFDTNLAKTTPKGAPSVKSFSRGAFFSY